MIEEFCVNGVHSYQTFGLRILERKIGSAPKDDMTERVPFSSVTYDFSRIYGKQSYGERILSYELEFVCMNKKIAQEKIISILKKLKWDGRKNLYDDLLCDFHYEVREPEIDFSENHGVYNFKMKFPANPEIKPNTSIVLPDVDGDSFVNSADASLILDAYSKISTGEKSGLTWQQLQAADADMDGKITSGDASLIMGFYSALATGQYECTTEGWTAYLNDMEKLGEGVI